MVARRTSLVPAVFALVLLAAPLGAQAQEPSPAPSPAPSSGPPRLHEDVVVQGVRADESAPVTTTTLTHADLERGFHGQEMPVLLALTPSIVQYSETGAGAGYSYFFLRGLHQSRVNMTLDGVPLNDPEEGALYFANFGDFAGALESAQVQRGVGTSSVGAASFAGSVNFESATAGGARRTDVEAGLGSWGTERGSAAFRSGDLGGGMSLFARGSLLRTDGYRERSGVDQRALYLGASRQGETSLLKIFGFAAHEATDLAFLASDADALRANPRVNIMAPEETDAFGQDFLHVYYTRNLGTGTTGALQAYYSGAQGAFRLFDDEDARDTLRSYGIDGQTVGLRSSVRVQRGARELTVGANASAFSRDHFQDVVGGDRAYTNTAHKSELAGFAKAGWTLGRLYLYGDAQLRHARFTYAGTVAQPSVAWSFFNPKAGARVTLARGLSAYASVGRTTREPARSDFFAGEDDPTLTYDLRAVHPERVVDVEAGVERHRGRMALQANLYAMEFRNEIAATGELSVVGYPLRRNAPRSFRRGLELDAAFQARRDLRFTLTGSASHDRLREWTQFFDLYDPDGAFLGQTQKTERNVRPLLTPANSATLAVLFSRANVDLGLSVRRVARLFLDNTDDPALAAPAWTSLDARAVFDLSRFVKTGAPRLRLELTNILDARIYASGYSYLFATREAGVDTPGGSAYFYPLATRSVYLTLQTRF